MLSVETLRAWTLLGDAKSDLNGITIWLNKRFIGILSLAYIVLIPIGEIESFISHTSECYTYIAN